jgi:hypothetical protein
MSFLNAIDKEIIEGVKRISNMTTRESTPAEKARATREAQYADNSRRYKRIVLKWLYIDKVPIEELKRMGVWKENLMSVNVSSMGGGPAIPGLPVIPILTPGTSRQQGSVTEEEAKETSNLTTYVAEADARVTQEVSEVDRQFAEVLREYTEQNPQSGIPRPDIPITDPRNFEGPEPSSSSPGFVAGSSIIGRAPPAAASGSAVRLNNSAPAAVGPRRVYRAFPPGTGKKRDAAIAEMHARGEVPMQSNEVRDALVKAIAKKRGASKPTGGETQTELNKKFKAAWTAAGKSGQTDAIIRELGEVGVFGGPGGDSSSAVAERIARLGATEQRRLLQSVFSKLGLQATYLVDIPQSGPGYDAPEAESKSGDDPLTFSIENRENILGGLERMGWDSRLAEAAFNGLVTTAVRYSQHDIASGAKADTVANRKAARRDAVNYLMQQIGQLQGIQSTYEQSNEAPNFAELARMTLDMVPFFANALRGNPVVNSVRDAYDRFQEIRQGLAPEPAESEQLLADPLAIARLEQVAGEVGLELTIDEKGIASLDADRGVLSAISQAVMSQRRRGGIVKMGSFMIYRATGGRAGSRPPLGDDELERDADFPVMETTTQMTSPQVVVVVGVGPQTDRTTARTSFASEAVNGKSEVFSAPLRLS